MHVKIEGLDARVEEVVRRALAEQREDDPWLNAKEAAAYTRLAVATIHDLVNDSVLPRHGARKERLRFRRSELDRFMEGRRRKPDTTLHSNKGGDQ